MQTGYQMLEDLSFCDRERASFTSFNNYNHANFSGVKGINYEAFRVYIFF